MTADRRDTWDRPGLQPERTDLSWVRTGLALMVNGGLLLLRHDSAQPGPLQLAASAVALVLALLTLWVSRRRMRVLATRPLPAALADPAPVALLAAGTTLLGLIILGALLVA